MIRSIALVAALATTLGSPAWAKSKDKEAAAPGAPPAPPASVASPASTAAPARPSPDAPRGPRKLRVAVLDVKAVGALDPKEIEGLSALIASETASRADIQVLGGSDMRAMIGFDRERALMGCSTSSCLAEIGGALGVDYLLSSEGSKVGTTILLSMALLEVSKSAAIKRLTKRVNGNEQLVDAAVAAVREVLGALPGPPSSAAAGAAGPMPGGVVPMSGESAQMAAPPRRSKKASWALVGCGALGLSVGLGMLVDAWGVHRDFQTHLGAGVQSVTRDQAEAAVARARTGTAIATVGTGLLGWGVLRLVWPEPAAPSLMVVPGSHGAALSYSTWLSL